MIGLLLQGVGGVIFFIAFSSSLARSLYADTSGSSIGMLIGGLVALVGWILLLVGVSRVSAGVDYLVRVAPSPAPTAELPQQVRPVVADSTPAPPPAAP